VVVLVKLRALDAELLDVLVERYRLDELLEVLAVIEGDLDESKADDDLGRLTEGDEALHRSLEYLALLKPEVDDTLVRAVLYGEEKVLNPDVAENLHSDGYALVVLGLDADGLRVAEVLVVRETHVQILPLHGLVLLLLIDFTVVIIDDALFRLAPRR
jgi:hypothetical protein